MPVPGYATRDDFEQMFEPSLLDRWGDRWLHRLRGSQALRLDLASEMAASVLTRGETLTVLDIGCGQGDFLLRLRSRFPRHEYHGTDISQNAIDYNRGHYPFIECQQRALPDVGYPAGTFDFVSALEVVYYLDEPSRKQALRAIADALKPGGRLLLSGVLDARGGYFDEQSILEQIRDVLSIERVGYNDAWLITRLEGPLIGAFNRLLTLDRLTRSSDPEWTEWCTGRSGWRLSIAKLARTAGLRQALAILTLPSTWLLRRIIASRGLARICMWLSRMCKGPAGRTHILVLARKGEAA